MLQHAQLRAVVDQFPEAIAVLHRFFLDAGLRPGTDGSLGRLAARLRHDRGFHRDLTSHVWILLHVRALSGGTSASQYADLLGIVAVAAAGQAAAAEAEEEDAHGLLGFLIEAGDAFKQLQQRPVPARVDDVAVEPVVVHRSAPAQVADRPRRKNRPVYAFASICLIALLLGGLAWLLSTHSAGEQRRSSEQASPGDTSSQSNNSGGQPLSQVPAGEDRAATAIRHSGLTSTRPGSLAHTSPDSLSKPTMSAPRDGGGSTISEAPSAGTTSMANPPAEIVRVPAPVAAVPSRVANEGSPSVVPGVRGTRPLTTVPAPIPASVLSRRLDSPAAPSYSNDPDVTATGRPYPRLRRRTGIALQDDATLMAEMNAPNLRAPTGVSVAGVRGVVRGTCLGMMAGNLVYSPSPAYPPAAAAAHVSGEVKVQATIDRDGSVSAARVVSGPPMLRDAALSAVEQWRYKPFTNGGKPSPTGTLAVVEFELP